MKAAIHLSLLSSLSLLCLSNPAASPAFLEQTNLWTGGTDSYHIYRIPPLLVTAKGFALAWRYEADYDYQRRTVKPRGLHGTQGRHRRQAE